MPNACTYAITSKPLPKYPSTRYLQGQKSRTRTDVDSQTLSRASIVIPICLSSLPCVPYPCTPTHPYQVIRSPISQYPANSFNTPNTPKNPISHLIPSTGPKARTLPHHRRRRRRRFLSSTWWWRRRAFLSNTHHPITRPTPMTIAHPIRSISSRVSLSVTR
jgi:hypothetical protein